ncbi:MAG: hypothetical protein KAT14_00320 [Candidatus Marinimicrobia bacterium]|nr:hypothetical protein [Candidatus Neomarinimicrobiota bacterium]
MKKEIISVDTKQSAKIFAITTAFFSLIISIVGLVALIVGLITGQNNWEFWGVYIIIPVVYLVVVYIFARIFFWIYNKVAARWGGVIVELEDEKEN